MTKAKKTPRCACCGRKVMRNKACVCCGMTRIRNGKIPVKEIINADKR